MVMSSSCRPRTLGEKAVSAEFWKICVSWVLPAQLVQMFVKVSQWSTKACSTMEWKPRRLY